MELRVATFNIRNGIALDGRHLWWLRRRATAGAIGDLDADVVGLQEAYGFQLRWLARRLGMEAVGSGRGGFLGGERCPVLARGPVVPSTWQVHRYASERPRIATLCELPGGVLVANTHLDERSAELREAALVELDAMLPRDRPVVVLGDLNAAPGEPELAPLSWLHDVVVEGGTAHRFRGGMGRRQIDHVLVSDHWEVLDATVVRRPAPPWPSDHWPVVATLRLRGEDARAR